MAKPRKEGVFEREGRWYFRYYDTNGKLVRQSAGAQSESEAWRKFHAHMELVKTEQGGVRWDKACEVFFLQKNLKAQSIKRYKTSMWVWDSYLTAKGIENLSDIDRKKVQAFVDARKKHDVTDASIRRDLAFLSTLWNTVRERPDYEDMLGENPVLTLGSRKDLKEKARVRLASEAEWRAIMAAASSDLYRSILTILVETGLREQELCSLTWDMIDWRKREIRFIQHLVQTKNDKMRAIPLTDTAFDTLCQMRDGTLPPVRHRTSRYVFWHGNGQRFARLSSWWRHTIHRSQVVDFRLHDIRHTFASNYLNAGGDIYVLSKILGHSDVKVTERYAHLLTQAMHADMKRIGLIAVEKGS